MDPGVGHDLPCGDTIPLLINEESHRPVIGKDSRLVVQLMENIPPFPHRGPPGPSHDGEPTLHRLEVHMVRHLNVLVDAIQRERLPHLARDTGWSLEVGHRCSVVSLAGLVFGIDVDAAPLGITGQVQHQRRAELVGLAVAVVVQPVAVVELWGDLAGAGAPESLRWVDAGLDPGLAHALALRAGGAGVGASAAGGWSALVDLHILRDELIRPGHQIRRRRLPLIRIGHLAVERRDDHLISRDERVRRPPIEGGEIVHLSAPRHQQTSNNQNPPAVLGFHRLLLFFLETVGPPRRAAFDFWIESTIIIVYKR